MFLCIERKVISSYGGFLKETNTNLSDAIYIEYAVDFKMALNGSSAVSIIAFNILNELLKGDEINEET